MNLLGRVSNPLELEKLIQQLYVAKNEGSADFGNLTNVQTKQIANALNNITGFAVRNYSYSMDNYGITRVPFVISSPDVGTEPMIIKDNQSNEIKFFPLGSNPYVIKGGDIDLSSFNGTGKYLRVYTQIDNAVNYDTLFGTNTPAFKDFVFGTYNSGAYFQVSVEDFGSPLQRSTNPYSVEIVNNISESFKIKMQTTYATEYLNTPSNQTYLTKQYQNWDYVYPYWSIDLSGKNVNVKFELYALDINGTPGNNQLVGNGYAYNGGNYNGDYYMGEMTPWNGYNTRKYRIVISYQ